MRHLTICSVKQVQALIIVVVGFLLSQQGFICTAGQISNAPVYANQWYKLDELESFRNEYGAIKVKGPDVWGQSRIMQHRAEYENAMAQQLTNFSVTFQGARNFSFQSAFANALSFSDALGGAVSQINGLSTNSSATNASIPANAAQSLLSSTSTPVVAIPTRNPANFGPNSNLTLEPIVALDQQSAYIKHLQQLRRINEGDDTADAAGYSLYLLRMPISVDLGRKTQQGYGAEVSIRCSQADGNHLLTNTFRRLVINDLAFQLSQALTPLLNSPTNLADAYKTVTNALSDSILFSATDTNLLYQIANSYATNSINKKFWSAIVTNGLSEDTVQEMQAFTKKQQLSPFGSQILADDLNRLLLNGLKPEFEVEDITNVQYFAAALRKPAQSDYFTTFLATNLTEFLTNTSCQTTNLLSEDCITNLVWHLNNSLTNVNLSRASHLAKIKLSAETTALLWRSKANDLNTIKWLNHLVIQDAFPQVFSRSRSLYNPVWYAPEWLSKETLLLLKASPQGSDLISLNRHLLLQGMSIPDALSKPREASLALLSMRSEAGNINSAAAGLLTAQGSKLSSEVANFAARFRTNNTDFKEFQIKLMGELKTPEDRTQLVYTTGMAPIRLSEQNLRLTKAKIKLAMVREKLAPLLRQLTSKVSSGRFSRSTFAFPNNELATFYGIGDLVLLAQRIHDDLGMNASDSVTALQIQKYLLENLEVAQRVLASANLDNINNNITALPQQVKSANIDEIEQTENKIIGSLANLTALDSVAPLLVWPVALESALLADQLKDQMHTFSLSLDLNLDPLLLKPTPSDEANFHSYVEKRWPIHAFALEPVSEDQNIQDASSLRDSMQLALSLALSTGKINASDYATYSQSLALDVQTAQLHHLLSAFSDGNDRFGWRFFPRFSASWNLKNRKSAAKDQAEAAIAPGMRECAALVILPSFVPDIKIETRARWFGLDNPAKTEPKLERMFYLSEQWHKRLDNYQDSFLLTAENTDVEDLILALSEDNTLAVHILGQLTTQTAAQIKNHYSLKNDWEFKSRVLHELNQTIIRGRSIYDENLFPTATYGRLPAEIQRLLNRGAEEVADYQRLNRLLLEYAYPHAISRKDYFEPGNHDYLKGDRNIGEQLLADLKAALPLQNLPVALPYETAIGGFSLFSDGGVAALGPELYGFEGSPVTDGTNDFTVHLIGNNFSVRGIQVLASGSQITNISLLSRQLMAATFPGRLITQTNQIEVAVATPYGVSGAVLIKPTFTGKSASAAPSTSKSGYTWQINGANTTNFPLQVSVYTNHVILPALAADNAIPFPHIVRQVGSGSDALLLPQAASNIAFKLSIVTDGGELPFSDSTNVSVLQISSKPTESFQFAGNELLSTQDFCNRIWPGLSNFVANHLDRFSVSNVVPANLSLKAATYVRLDNGTVVQTDNPLVFPLIQ